MILTRKAFEKLAKTSGDICIPIKTGREAWQYVTVDKESFLKSLKDGHVRYISLDKPAFDGAILWLNTPNT